MGNASLNIAYTDALTFGGKSPDTFHQSIPKWTSGDISTLALEYPPGTVEVGPSVTGMPIDGYSYYGEVMVSGKDRLFRVTRVGVEYEGVYIRKYNGTEWSSWQQSPTRNENILINPDFSIDQRSFDSSYVYINDSGSGSKYTVDRWAIGPHSKLTKFHNMLRGDYVILSQSDPLDIDSVATLGQVVEDPDRFSQMPLTLTMLVNGRGTMFIQVNNTKYAIDIEDTDSFHIERISVPASATSRISKLIVGCTTTSNIDIKYAKLERGSVATKFETPDHTTELLKCQRYYFEFNHRDANGSCVLGTAHANSSAIFEMPVMLPTVMRTTPSIIMLVDGYRSDSAFIAYEYATGESYVLSNMQVEFGVEPSPVLLISGSVNDAMSGMLTKGSALSIRKNVEDNGSSTVRFALDAELEIYFN